ncbi:MAG: DUF3131 domain-containing protein [Clostridia bacterium]|nr:DUF3131 domain-containing protein [Clostridia bacterium]
MYNTPYKLMKSDKKIFRKYSAAKTSENETVKIISEHYPMLERCAAQSAKEYGKTQKRFKDPNVFSGLFDKCREMCSDGEMPDSEVIVKCLQNNISGNYISYIPLIITSTLIHVCAQAVVEDDCKTAKNSILSLQKMRDTDFDYISEKLFSAEDILQSDPADIYSCMNSETKARYRRRIASISVKKGKTERETAADILEKAKKNGDHIGNYLFTTVKNPRRGTVYLIMEAVMPALICISSGILSGEWLLSFLLYLPVWEILRHPIEKISVNGALSGKLMSLAPESTAVSEVCAMITLSVILPSVDKMDEIRDRLEDLYLSNAYGNIKICCLADFKASDIPRKPEDKHIMNALSNIIDSLNDKYGGGFIAAVRPRSYSETQNEFIGKERKRGAIRELVRAVKGNEKGFLLLKGDTEHLKDTKYLITLDYDSRPVFDSVRELIAVAEHPVNKPVIKNGRVVSGYGILAPKTQNSLSSSLKTFFSSVMSQNAGISLYDEYSCERYNSLFGESIFCGKGLINIDAYHQILDNSLPKERILSHDIIEGEFLRTGFVPGVQILEDFPATADAYYKRMHRWVRGDWQNAGFIFGKNPLSFASRFKLFDNLRRSITPVICVAVIIYSAFYQGYAGITAAVISLFSICTADIFAGINSVVHGGLRTVTGLYYSKMLPRGLGCFLRAFVSVAYSAREACFCFDAIFRALWRVLISGDNLLEWTTSASAEQREELNLSVSCLPALLISAVLIVFGLPIHRMAGLIILADIPLMMFGNSPFSERKNKVSKNQREYLLSHASAIWGYFNDLCGEENNFLSPDNIQFAPHRAVARRTSPTNIGLMLACIVAARDFGFITTEEMKKRIDLSLSSIEKLEKYKGNLMNWYSTETLETLEPRFVSAVDSGNFLCCLTAVKEGIREYISECKELELTAERIEKIIDSTNLNEMFNRNRNLFCIGINPDNGIKTESCYDLYMSEIRMTAYFAVARGYVTKKHWASLDRPLITDGRYMGLASWTGTMFEYFMADIFVPAPYGSMSYEALCFCLQKQRKKAGKNPFGISESAFYAFDGDLNYQYKAHGVQKLGLKRNLDKENVISPYSSFLTLNIAPHLSVKNLKRLEKSGMNGKYGLYEAADFTKGRKSGKYSIVNSFMVHHIGMSFLSINNLLNEKCMQRRFMKDGYMVGAKTLLEEKPPEGKDTFKDVVSDTVIPCQRERIYSKASDWYNPDPYKPEYFLFLNGRTTLCVSDTGLLSVMFDGEKRFTLKLSDRIETNIGSYSFLDGGFQVRASKNRIEYQSDYGDLKLSMQIYLLANSNCIIKKYSVENKCKKNIVKGRLITESTNENIRYYSAYGFPEKEAEGYNGTVETEFEILPKGISENIFAFAADISEDEAINSYESLKVRKKNYQKAVNPFAYDSFICALSEKYLRDIINHKTKGVGSCEMFGITHDYPVILVKHENHNNLDLLKPFIVFNKILRNCGIKNTLVICNYGTKDTKTSALQTIETFLSEEGCSLMLGIGGGVYVFDEKFLNKTNYRLLEERSAVKTSV